jgi:hypothetical protein
MKMKRVTLTILLLAATCGVAAAQDARDAKPRDVMAQVVGEEKRRDILRLLELTKAADLGAQVAQQMMGTMRANFAMLPPETREKVFKTFEEELTKEFSREKLIEAVLPIYDRHLSAEDVKGLIAFYESPLGQRTVNVLPSIARESYEDGARRGREAGVRAMTRIMSEGILSQETLPTAQLELPKSKPKPKARRRVRRN